MSCPPFSQPQQSPRTSTQSAARVHPSTTGAAHAQVKQPLSPVANPSGHDCSHSMTLQASAQRPATQAAWTLAGHAAGGQVTPTQA